jgi:hypothetical protein
MQVNTRTGVLTMQKFTSVGAADERFGCSDERRLYVTPARERRAGAF